MGDCETRNTGGISFVISSKFWQHGCDIMQCVYKKKREKKKEEEQKKEKERKKKGEKWAIYYVCI